MHNIAKIKKKRVIIISVILAVLIFIVIPFSISIYVYEDNFGKRFSSYEPLSYSADNFPGLCAERLVFDSNNGQELVGYKYYAEGLSDQYADGVSNSAFQLADHSTSRLPRGVIVFAHGFGGGGHNSYMPCADVLTRNGYVVFAFDATGNDESGGEVVGGLPQGVIDLDYALRFVESSGEFDGLPVMLFGHSWGGYAIGSVLADHPEVRAAVILSGIDSSSDLIKAGGQKVLGSAIGLLMPYFRVVEYAKFGRYADVSCARGFDNSDAGVMVIHSADDETVPIEYGYDIWYEKYAENGRFLFLRYEDRGHDRIYYSEEARAYIDSFNEDFAFYVESLENGLTPEIKAQYIEEHLDRDVWNNLTDSELFMDIVAFYDAYATTNPASSGPLSSVPD